MALRLSVLDQSPVSEGSTTAEALRNSIDLARHAEAEGFHRYWVAEHHGTPMLAGTSPEILIGLIAAQTARLRVGSGGIMLPHYSPLKVAETFGMLASLYPDRIDLAVGRAAGTDPLTAFALQRDRRHASPDDFPEQLAELLAYVRDGFPEGHRLGRVRQSPAHTPCPTAWLLGSSPQSAVWAAECGLPYAFADFINPAGASAARHYRKSFVPSPVMPSTQALAQSRRLEAPQVVVAVWVLVADTTDEAHRLASSAQVAFLQFLSGQPIQVPPVEKALKYLAQRPETLQMFAERRRAVIGAPAAVRAQLEEVAQEYGAEEVMVVTITHDHDARKRSYGLLAEAFRTSS